MYALFPAIDPRTYSAFFIQHRFDDPGKSWSDDAKQTYHPHLTLRRYCNPDNIAGEAHKCSDAIQDHVGSFRSQLGLIIRGITLFRDTSLGPRVVCHFPFGGSNSSCMFQIRLGHFFSNFQTIARRLGSLDLEPVSVLSYKTVVRTRTKRSSGTDGN